MALRAELKAAKNHGSILKNSRNLQSRNEFLTPLHPRTNGEVERFMQTLNKTETLQVCNDKTVIKGEMRFKTCLSPTDEHLTQLKENLMKSVQGHL